MAETPGQSFMHVTSGLTRQKRMSHGIMGQGQRTQSSAQKLLTPARSYNTWIGILRISSRTILQQYVSRRRGMQPLVDAGDVCGGERNLYDKCHTEKLTSPFAVLSGVRWSSECVLNQQLLSAIKKVDTLYQRDETHLERCLLPFSDSPR